MILERFRRKRTKELGVLASLGSDLTTTLDTRYDSLKELNKDDLDEMVGAYRTAVVDAANAAWFKGIRLQQNYGRGEMVCSGFSRIITWIRFLVFEVDSLQNIYFRRGVCILGVNHEQQRHEDPTSPVFIPAFSRLVTGWGASLNAGKGRLFQAPNPN